MAVERLEAGFEDAMAVIALPEQYQKRLRTTNGTGEQRKEVSNTDTRVSAASNGLSLSTRGNLHQNSDLTPSVV
ncbi:hypothetical protein V3F56_04975 [Moorellaceae bacterium AZ2]